MIESILYIFLNILFCAFFILCALGFIIAFAEIAFPEFINNIRIKNICLRLVREQKEREKKDKMQQENSNH